MLYEFFPKVIVHFNINYTYSHMYVTVKHNILKSVFKKYIYNFVYYHI